VPSYRFTGYATLGYPAYRDAATGAMLSADPGGVYEMQSVTLMDPVPPSDGRWEAVPAGMPATPPPVVAAPPPPPPPPPVSAPADGGPAE
jgi:hypothetical protein